MRKMKTQQQFENEVKLINPNIKIIGEYTGALKKVKCKCKVCDNTWNPYATHILHGMGCPKCASRKRAKSNDEFITEMRNINPNISIIEEYVSSKDKIKAHCNICGAEWEASPDSLVQGHGCPKCANNMRYTTNTFKDAFYKVNSDIEIIGEYKNSHTPIRCKCLLCGNIWNPTPNNLMSGKGCSHCSSSKGEKKIKYFLDVNNISYIRNARFEGLKGIGDRSLSYDFYIPSNNLLIEYQGKQHFEPIDYFGGVEYFDIQTEHDKRKQQYAIDNNIELLEICYYDDNIGDILANKLNTA